MENENPQQEPAQNGIGTEHKNETNVKSWQAVTNPDRRTRQAIVVIHGIGEQCPMNTLRNFVDAVLDNSSKGSKYRSKPDAMNRTLEARCLQAPANHQSHRPLTDFYEYYWAHHMQGSKYTHVLSWLLNLIWRNPNIIPKAMKPAYCISWGLIIFTIALFGSGLFFAGAGSTSFFTGLKQQKLLFTGGLITLVIQWIGSYFILGYVADAARYLNPSPDNIEARNKIRSEGINLLHNLHTSGKYDRIVVVGHSLGSVIGYDIIRNLWVDLRKPTIPNIKKQYEIKRFEQEANKLEDGDVTKAKIEAFQQCQHRLWQEFQVIGVPWLITDFVTLGSPLTHAQLLMADNPKDLEHKQTQYEYPCCPPSTKEKIYYDQQYSHKVNASEITRNLFIPHHGAPFSCIRWTNLYFPYHRLIFGDVIGGPLNGVFGKGIRDIAVTPSTENYLDCTLASHTCYWSNSNQVSDKNSLETLRKVLRLDFLHGKNKNRIVTDGDTNS